MPWQQSRTIKRHLQRDAEALELRNSNQVQNNTADINLDVRVMLTLSPPI
jgi:hypothetical protein